jgi:hypothetical protein
MFTTYLSILCKVQILYGRTHVIPCVGNVTEETFYVNMFAILTGSEIQKLCWNLLTF